MKLGFLGAGKRATALARGFIHAGLAAADSILASDPYEAARNAIARDAGIKTSTANAEVLKFARVIVLAVKPDQVNDVLAGVRSQFTDQHLLISIAAGVTLARIEAALPAGARVIRVMPNTPALVGQGASAFALAGGCTAADEQQAQELLSSVGQAYRVEEKLLDAVTGLSGSGPAYVFLIIEALSDGGVRMGLPRDLATALAVQTLRGAAEMLLVEKVHPSILKDRVTSPGGTTIAGLQALEDRGVRGAMIAAVEAATKRSLELGK